MAPYCFAGGRNKNSEGERSEAGLPTPFTVRTGLTKIGTSSFASCTRSRNLYAGKRFPFLKEFQPENRLVCFFQHDS
jgi:hypothetical protein